MISISRNEFPGMHVWERAHENMAVLGHALADGFAAPGHNIAKRFSKLLDHACRAFHMDHGYVTLMGGLGPIVKFQSSDAPQARLETVDAQLLSMQIMKNRSVFSVPDSEAHDDPDIALRDWSGGAPSCFLGAPILFDGRVHGTIEFGGSKPRIDAFTELELAMLKVLATYASGPLILLGEAAGS